MQAPPPRAPMSAWRSSPFRCRFGERERACGTNQENADARGRASTRGLVRPGASEGGEASTSTGASSTRALAHLPDRSVLYLSVLTDGAARFLQPLSTLPSTNPRLPCPTVPPRLGL